MAVLGPSGCGKTTLLQILAGLLPADQGQMRIEGRDVLSLPARQRGVLYLSQEALLFPHMNVEENIAFGLSIRGVSAAEQKREVGLMLEQLGLSGFGHRSPESLSGGQRQRVAFGRAMIVKPGILLLDEPFGSLDVQTRAEMQELYRRLSAERQSTTLFVTHDIREALIMGDELSVMKDGVLQVFESRKAFLRSPDNAAKRELNFWQGVFSGEGSRSV